LECGDLSPLSYPATRRLARRDESRRAKAPTSRRTPNRFGCGYVLRVPFVVLNAQIFAAKERKERKDEK